MKREKHVPNEQQVYGGYDAVYCEQCETCKYRDRTEFDGVEIGWKKDVCKVYCLPGEYKPSELLHNEIMCPYLVLE